MAKNLTTIEPNGGRTFASVDVRTAQRTDPVLSEIARQYRPEGFIADELAPRITVQKETGQYVVYGKREFFASDESYLKPDRSPAKEIDLEESTERYTCEEYAVRVSISRRERENADDQIRLEQSKLALAQDQLAVARELRVATLLQEADTTGGGLDAANESTPGVNWDIGDDPSTATIEADIVEAIEGIADDIGYVPNTIVLPFKVANAVAQDAKIRDVIKYTVNGQQTLAQGAGILPGQLWGLNVLVARPYHTTSKEGDSTPTLAQVWGDDVRVLWVNPNAAWGTPSVAYTFQTRGAEVRRFMQDDVPLEWIEVSEVVHEKVVAPEAGWEIKSLLTP